MHRWHDLFCEHHIGTAAQKTACPESNNSLQILGKFETNCFAIA